MDPTAKPARLIVNGDDFGLSEPVNEAIVRAFREGILTSCSLMVSGDAFEHAVALARAHPGLDVGVHLVTVAGRAVLSPSLIPSLVDRRGRFSSSPTLAGIRYYFSARAQHELRLELTAQVEKFRATGLRCSHLDSHVHMHVHPAIFRIMLDLAVRYAIPRVRLPRDSLRLALRVDRGRALTKCTQAAIFALLCRPMARELAARGIAFPQRVYGHLQTGRLTEGYVLAVLAALEPGVSELYGHPALHRPGPGERLGPWEREQLAELAVLTSPAVRHRVEERGIELVSYRALQAAP